MTTFLVQKYKGIIGRECFQVEVEVGGRKYEDVPVAEIEEGRHDLLSWACQPGDVVVFHGLTIHGAK